MENAIANVIFCPDKVFNILDAYITLVQTLDNVPVLNPRKIMSRTLGLISLCEKLGQKEIEIIKDGLVLYKAEKTTDWQVFEFNLNDQQVLAIESLPQTKEQVLIEFYGRKLTHKLKKVFQSKNYPVNKHISLNHAQVPYSFWIDSKSTSSEIFFVGINTEDNVVFESSLNKSKQVKVIKNYLSLEHINQLSSFDP
ncbi:hypothetical protein NIES4102_41710 (plasmid) [Chondrocystis sp. NIES-4102]|nr:hypothetical protein NIES4102_41710 [Chondrocystis sp. NIES-4102]